MVQGEFHGQCSSVDSTTYSTPQSHGENRILVYILPGVDIMRFAIAKLEAMAVLLDAQFNAAPKDLEGQVTCTGLEGQGRFYGASHAAVVQDRVLFWSACSGRMSSAGIQSRGATKSFSMDGKACSAVHAIEVVCTAD